MEKHSTKVIRKISYINGRKFLTDDDVIIEQPLQISLYFPDKDISVEPILYVLTMRTPGDDKALIVGLLLSQGILKKQDDLVEIKPEEDFIESTDDNASINSWEVTLSNACFKRITPLNKYQQTYSSCGLCGTASVQSLELQDPPLLNESKNWLSIQAIYQFMQRMKTKQTLFSITGGVHAAALFNHIDNTSKNEVSSDEVSSEKFNDNKARSQNTLLSVKEDIGRHNALDKLLGEYWLTNDEPLRGKLIAVLSSRVSFEMIQKAVMSGVCVLIAIGAPSDLAIKAAQRFNLTLIAFANEHSFNVYHAEWRLV